MLVWRMRSEWCKLFLRAAQAAEAMQAARGREASGELSEMDGLALDEPSSGAAAARVPTPGPAYNHMSSPRDIFHSPWMLQARLG